VIQTIVVALCVIPTVVVLCVIQIAAAQCATVTNVVAQCVAQCVIVINVVAQTVAQCVIVINVAAPCVTRPCVAALSVADPAAMSLQSPRLPLSHSTPREARFGPNKPATTAALHREPLAGMVVVRV